jgi:hypothetical protein
LAHMNQANCNSGQQASTSAMPICLPIPNGACIFGAVELSRNDHHPAEPSVQADESEFCLLLRREQHKSVWNGSRASSPRACSSCQLLRFQEVTRTHAQSQGVLEHIRGHVLKYYRAAAHEHPAHGREVSSHCRQRAPPDCAHTPWPLHTRGGVVPPGPSMCRASQLVLAASATLPHAGHWTGLP